MGDEFCWYIAHIIVRKGVLRAECQKIALGRKIAYLMGFA